jgi:transcriptional regulator with XRE-family HTH domain
MNTEICYAELRGLIRSKYKTQAKFAEAIGMSACSLSKKLNGKAEWTAEEIRRTCEVLGISAENIPFYFFYPMR